MVKMVKASEARSNFNELINRVRYGKEQLIITHHNQEAAVLISTADFAKLKTLEASEATYNFSDLIGKLEWQGDALEAQQALRDEW